MSKIILLAVFAMVAVTAMLAAPMEEFANAELSEGVEAFSEQDFADPAQDHLRFRRVTCDLLSFGEYVAHSACAANCLSMGKAGGRCNSGVCQCRKTNVKDLWDKRFG